MNIVDFSTKRPVTVMMLITAVCLFGLISVARLGLNLLPELSYPTLTIRTEYPGSAPAEVEHLISKPIEEVVGVTKNLKTIHSISAAGSSDVILKFQWGTDMEMASLEVREKLDQLTRLPLDVQQPTVLRFNPANEAVLKMGLYFREQPTDDQRENAYRQLREFAEDHIKQRLESVAGIAAVRINGGLEQEIQILVDQEKLAQLHLNIDTISNTISNANINLAGGSIDDGKQQFLIRTINQYKSLDDIRNTIIPNAVSTTDNNRQIIRLQDVASVNIHHKERKNITRINGRESVEIAIYKEGDANTIQVADITNKRLGYIKNEFPEKYQLINIYDQSVFIQNAINDVLSAAIWGCLFAILVLYLFLHNAWATFIISLSIPVSVIATFAMMNYAEVTLNIMSLGGIALAVGLLVDNSIVVLENIARYRDQGLSALEAARKGCREVSSAVFASTLTTIAVFLPMVFVEGIAGQLFHDQALTVTFALFISLLVALSMIPMLSARNNEESEDHGEQLTPAVINNPFENIGTHLLPEQHWSQLVLLFIPRLIIYGLILGLWYLIKLMFENIINHLIPEQHLRWIVLLFIPRLVIYGIILSLWRLIKLLSIWLSYCVLKISNFTTIYATLLFRLPLVVFERCYLKLADFYTKLLTWAMANPFPVIVSSLALFAVTLTMIPRLGMELIPEISQGEFIVEYKLPTTTALALTDQTINKTETIVKQLAGVNRTYSSSGESQFINTSNSRNGPNTGKLNIVMDNHAGKAEEQQAMHKLREFLNQQPGIEAEFKRPELFTFTTPLEIELASYNLQGLQRASNRIIAALEKSNTFIDVHSTMESGYPEVQVRFDHDRASRLGIFVPDIAQRISAKVRGHIASQYSLDDKKIDMIIRVAEKDRDSIADIKQLIVNPESDKPIPLSAIADIAIHTGPVDIQRVDQQRVALISSNIQGTDLSSAAHEAQQIIDNLHLPSDIVPLIKGQNQEMEESSQSLYFALGLAIFMVYLVMASLFESLLQPFIILFSIPLALIGSVWALYLTSTTLSVIALIGLIMLAGIVVNNAIVLIDRINQLREQGMEKSTAIFTAARSRLRPIVMTTLTTVMGLLPMALSFGDGAEIRAPMAITVIGGLLVSTLLTLLIIPLVYQLLDRRKTSH